MTGKKPEEGHPLDKLREPFKPNQISKLPKESRAQIDARKADRNVAINCTICGGWHHKNAVHLDYVGHAALTNRLLDTDISWSWEPLAFGQDGLPLFDRNNGLWIKLTVQGVTRLGFGSADGKQGGDAIKEIIGDALRNAAMRFGAALDLWHKGDLHAEESEEVTVCPISTAQAKELRKIIVAGNISEAAFCEHVKVDKLENIPAEYFAEAKAMLEKKAKARQPESTPEIAGDEVPY